MDRKAFLFFAMFRIGVLSKRSKVALPNDRPFSNSTIVLWGSAIASGKVLRSRFYLLLNSVDYINSEVTGRSSKIRL
ncbi:MAG TPA: hypothetical protein VL134_14190 [Leptolyngbya sp.]|nr:hypothetical protein [Leptolyngbya sp.]